MASFGERCEISDPSMDDFSSVRKANPSRRNCTVPLCTTYGTVYDHARKRKVTYHKIPEPKEIQAAWLHRIKRDPDFKVTNNTFVCSQHFPDEDMEMSGFSGRWRVLPGRLPTIFKCWEHRTSLLSTISKKRPGNQCQQGEASKESASKKRPCKRKQDETLHTSVSKKRPCKRRQDETLHTSVSKKRPYEHEKYEISQESTSNATPCKHDHNDTSHKSASKKISLNKCQADEVSTESSLKKRLLNIHLQDKTSERTVSSESTSIELTDVKHIENGNHIMENKNTSESVADLAKSNKELIAEVYHLREQLNSAKLKITELEKKVNEMEFSIDNIAKKYCKS